MKATIESLVKSKIESGINTYLGNFNQLIDVCAGFGASYNPKPANLQIYGLKEKATLVQRSIDAVDTALAVAITAESARQKQFALLLPLATRILAEATISGLPSAIIVHIKEIVRKIRGQRAKAIKPVPEGWEVEPEKHISVSQVSFVEQIEHFNQIVKIVESQPLYAPTEADLTVASLQTFYAALVDTNSAAVTASVPLATARQVRDDMLYNPETGMMTTALLVKEYVKAVFGATSQQYKEVKHISFRNKKI
jgi:hypothetical protein